MGDPKFSRRSYDTPSHPWQGERIKKEVEIVREFGLKNKTEVWKAQTILRNFRKQSRELQARLRGGDAQAKVETDALFKKCSRMGLLPVTGSDLNDILILSENDILSRRLQTVVYEKGLSSTIKQARQMITHGHIHINGHRVTVPGYIVSREEEASVIFNDASPFTDDMHPMRASPEQMAAIAAMKAEAKEKADKETAAKAKADAEEAGITVEDGEV